MNWYKKANCSESCLGIKRDFAGICVNVENPAGTIRSGIDPDGHEWHIDMLNDYGFVYALKGADGEGLDVYLGPDHEAECAYVVHQVEPDSGEFDEHKVMLGFQSEKDAKKAYLDHYDNPDFFGSIEEMKFSDFKSMVDGDKTPKFRWKLRKSSSSKGLVKTASTHEAEWGVDIADFQRWVVDAIEVKAYVSKTPYKIAITVNVWNSHLGEMMFQEFWKFGTNEISLAKSVFKKIIAKMESIIDQFREEESPNNLIHAYFRSELRKIDSEHLPRTNIPTINYSLDIPYEKDWRSTIYGNRYPDVDTSDF